MAIGFGIIGCGMIANFHCKAVADIRNAKVTACFDMVPAAADRLAAQVGCRAYHDLEAMLADPAVQVVTICTPSGAHMEPAVAAAKAGKHVIVEKPLDVTLKRCDAIIDACAAAGVTLATIFPSRFHESAQLLKRAVEQGRFGQLTIGDAYVKWYRTQEYYDKGGWRGTWKYDGGGSLINQSIHTIDLQRYIMGDPEWLFGKIGVMSHKIETEDLGLAILQFKGGARGVIEGSTSVYPGLPERLEVHGEKATAIIEGGKMMKWAMEGEQEGTEEKAKLSAAAEASAITADSHALQIQDFVDAIGQDRKPLVDGLEGRKALEVVVAVYRSSQTGKVVKFPIR